jgi:hypothetical protein
MPFYLKEIEAELSSRLPCAALLLWFPKWGGILYFDIPSPNTTVFSVLDLWPPSIALWGSLVPPYTLLLRLEKFAST